MTTEQALRRLRILGLTAEDEPIQRALSYMRGVLSGQYRPPDGREKVLNWNAFEGHMMAAWIRLFVPNDPCALPIARFWGDIVTASFQEDDFNRVAYETAYRARIPKLYRGERLIDLSQFYMVNLLPGMLDCRTESKFFDFITNHEAGIYYVYNFPITDLPPEFATRRTSRWLAALEMLAQYPCAKEKLQFAVDWLHACRDDDGSWDLGPAAKDGIYFPLSDSWRTSEDRKRDCTFRINALLEQLRL